MCILKTNLRPHIVDAKAKLSSEDIEILDMHHNSDRYAVYNGLLLCNSWVLTLMAI